MRVMDEHARGKTVPTVPVALTVKVYTVAKPPSSLVNIVDIAIG